MFEVLAFANDILKGDVCHFVSVQAKNPAHLEKINGSERWLIYYLCFDAC